jgi:hypothetical protein
MRAARAILIGLAVCLVTTSAVAFAADDVSAPCRVLLTTDRADPSWYELVQDIQFTKRFNRPTTEGARKDLAKRAHKLGADAVLNVAIESKRTVLSFPNSIIEARGRAIRWTPVGRERSFELQGSCYSVKGKPIEQMARTIAPEQPRKKFPWGALIAGAVVGAAAIGAATSSGTTYAAPVELPPAVVSPYVRTYSIDSVSRGGEVLVLSDGSAWAVEWRDQFRAAMWGPVQRVSIVDGSRYGQYVLVRDGAYPETITVTSIRR